MMEDEEDQQEKPRISPVIDDEKSENDEVKQAELSPLPLYQIEVPEAVKRAENVLFTIQVRASDEEEKGFVVLRQFEDLEWLYHNLVTGNNMEGIIMPPLPVKPMSDPKSAESLSRKQLGDNTKMMRGDQFEVDCLSVQVFLEQILIHPTFGRDKNLADFLTNDEAPVRAKLNKGLITRLSFALDAARKSGSKDIDDYYTTQRNFSTEFSKAIKETSLNFNKLLVAQWRLSSSYRALATELTSCTADRDESLVKINRLLKYLSDGCEDEAGCYELKSTKGEMTLGFYLDLFARYSENLKEMHLRRVNALHYFQSTEKDLGKAKPAKRDAAEEAFEAAKKSYENTSEQGTKEINRFTQLRLSNSAEALTKYAELQMKISQDFYAQLLLSRKAVLELQL